MANYTETKAMVPDEERSYFDGGYLAYIGYNMLVFFVTLITLGLAYPWMTCLMQKWKAKHTVICGKRMYFDGTGIQLIGKYLLWYLLTVITFGIYGFWMSIAMKKWVCKHTHFVGEEDNNSYFDGGVWGLLGTNILSTVVAVVPVVGFAWSAIIKLQWETRHTVTDSRRLIFTGTVGSLFVKYLLWGFLTLITFGIFALFMPVKKMRWETERIIDNEHTTEERIKRSEYRTNVHTDAATFKTYHVENEMESVKAGITDAMSESDLLQLANSGVRAAQYAYVVRHANGRYTEEPFSSLLKAAAEAEYAPAMSLYAQTHVLDDETKKALLIKAADKGQMWAIKVCLVSFAQEALQMKEDQTALPALKNAVRYADLLQESGETLTGEEETLAKNCIFAIRRIQSSKVASNGGKIAAIVIAALIGVPLLLALIVGVFALFKTRVGPSGFDYNDGASMVGGVQDGVSAVDFWRDYSGEMENESFYNITEIETVSAGENGSETTYKFTCNHWYWESEFYVKVCADGTELTELQLYGDRVLDEDSPDPTINQSEIVTATMAVYKCLGLGEYEDIAPYTESGFYSETHGAWEFQYNNTRREMNITIVKQMYGDMASQLEVSI